MERFHRIDWTAQVNRIRVATERYNRACILVDSTGVGEPVYERLSDADCDVEGYVLTNRSKNDLINNLALLIEQQRIVLPRPDLWPEGIEELESFQYSVTEQGTIRSGAPFGVHDDCVIALALAAWHAPDPDAPPVAFDIMSLADL